jgi:hypothetical protein
MRLARSTRVFDVARRGSGNSGAARRGYLLVEALVYFAVLLVIMGAAYAALYRCIDHAAVVSRNANDITSALHVGERWRADIRAAASPIQVETTETNQVLRLRGAGGQVEYRFAEGALYRRLGNGPWGRLLNNVKASSMQPDPRGRVTAWRWELELQPEHRGTVKASRIRPLFTFVAVPQTASAP